MRKMKYGEKADFIPKTGESELYPKWIKPSTIKYCVTMDKRANIYEIKSSHLYTKKTNCSGY